MSFKLSTKNIHFLRKLCVLTNIFLITPWYDFDNHCYLMPCLSKLYACTFLIFKIFFVFLSIQKTIENAIFQKLYVTQQFFLILFYVVMLLQHIFQILLSTFVFQLKWKTMITNFEYVDGKLGNRNSKEIKVWKNFYFRFGIAHIMFGFFFAWYFYFWLSISDENEEILVIVSGIDMYTQFLLIFFLRSLVKCFVERYQDLGCHLVLGSFNREDIVNHLKAIKTILRRLKENVQIFNETFGYFLLLIIINCGFDIVHCGSFMFVNVSVFKDVEHHAIIFNLFAVILYSV